MVRVGKVSSINEKKCTVKVLFEDLNGIVSSDLFVIVPCTGDNKAFFMPTVGERVVCLFENRKYKTGFVLGSFYSDNRLPPKGDSNKMYLKIDDPLYVEYDKKEKTLNINCEGDIKIIGKTIKIIEK